MEPDSLTRAWAVALDAVPTDELGPVATSMLRSARPLGDIEGTILLAVPNGFTKQWIEDKAQNKLTTALSVNLGRPVRIAITVDPSLELVETKEEEEEEEPHSRAGSSDPRPGLVPREEKEGTAFPRRGGLPRRHSSHAPEPKVHLRYLRYRPVESFRARRRVGRVGVARQRLQPSLYLRRLRAG